ncbi:hypothetical protein Y1Q_0014058 [Alligator mississippiensis]|uniref:Uncharacterized protein n=1 Tax=Alligator mississippiensis TaxID=8496 RepID=A0A151MLB7_ALLMI|nr:hypothetical protein Y1Q_0014058 [Alligator mississippiensis]
MSSYLYTIKYKLPLVIQTFLDLSEDTGAWYLDGNVLIVGIITSIVLPLVLMRHPAYTTTILAFVFVCHPEVLPIYTELHRGSGAIAAAELPACGAWGLAGVERAPNRAAGCHPHTASCALHGVTLPPPSLIFILPSIFYICLVPPEKVPLCSQAKIQSSKSPG